jgi:hypothetical protein
MYLFDYDSLKKILILGERGEKGASGYRYPVPIDMYEVKKMYETLKYKVNELYEIVYSLKSKNDDMKKYPEDKQ